MKGRKVVGGVESRLTEEPQRLCYIYCHLPLFLFIFSLAFLLEVSDKEFPFSIDLCYHIIAQETRRSA